MTEEQKRKFQEKFDGWYPTEEQFQYGKEHCSFDNEREIIFKKLDYLLSLQFIDKYWDSDVIPLFKELENYDKLEEEMKELYGITECKKRI